MTVRRGPWSASRRRRAPVVAVVASLIVSGAVVARPTALASGTDDVVGPWTIRGTWQPWQSCIVRQHRAGEGGACGLARPADVDEAVTFVATRDGVSTTWVAGPLRRDADRVTVEAPDGRGVQARIVRGLVDRYFVAPLQGRVAVAKIEVRDRSGRLLDQLDHAPLPPPPAPATVPARRPGPGDPPPHRAPDQSQPAVRGSGD